MSFFHSLAKNFATNFMLKLLWANLKMTFRDKQAIFWSLVFPLMFIVIFGLFDFSKLGDTKYVIIDESNSQISQQFEEGLQAVEIFKKQETPPSIDEAKDRLKNGDVDVVIVIPEGFHQEQMALQADGSVAALSPIQVFYSASNATINQIALNVVDEFIDQMNMRAAQAPTLFSYTSESIETKDVKYIDMIMPGILGMAIMTSAVIGISTGISRYREQKLLKRLSATPIKVRTFLMGEVLSFLIVNLMQISLIILFARIAFHVQVYGSYFLIYAISIFGSIIFLNLGFAVAGYSKNTKTAEAMSQIVTMPMMFFSGVFFSTDALPNIVGKIVEYLPLTPMIEALRSVSINGEGLSAISSQLAFMGGWIVLSFFIAWKLFKFKDA